jgi:hypothetical protein
MRCLLGLLSLVCLVGCARVNVSTEVNPDGSFKRKVEFAATKNASGGEETKLEDYFLLPKQGAGVVIERSVVEDETILKATRSLPIGGKAVDDAVIVNKSKPQIANEATVTALGDGRWRYSEKIYWKGEAPPEGMGQPAEFRAVIKKALPSTADTATIDRVTRSATVALWRVLFGPSDPMLSMIVMHPALAERRFRQRAAAAVDGVLAKEGVSQESRKTVLKQLAQEADFKQVFSPKKEAEKQSQGGESGTGSNLVPMLFAVKLPGEVLESNGENDPLSGEVFWALYPESAGLEPVELWAVYKP